VTSLVVDPTSNFIISGSSDATIHVWSLPQLLAFSKPPSTGRGQRAPNSPLLSFSNHRTPVTAIALGHSSSRCNFAVSTAADNTAVVWEYTTGLVLRTFLLPSTAISIAVDPADRAFYVGYDSGNVQQIDFYESSSIQHPLYDTRLQTTPSQIAAEHQWTAPSGETGAATSLGLSYDGMTLLSGHSSGSVLSWDVARGKYTSTVANFPTSVTNLHMLPPSGFSQHHSNDSKFTIHNVIKPRYDQSMSDASQSNAVVPPSYSFSVQLTLPSEGNSKAGIFTEAMMHPSFPKILIEEGLAELSALKNPIRPTASLDEANGSSAGLALKEEIATLKKQLSANENARRATTEELVQLRSNLSGLQDYTNELQQKQAKIDRERVTNQVNNEERDFQLRQAWFEAEKNGRNGDAILRKARSRSQDASGLDQMSE
jgi:pre-rRNA-processing protein IPI3